MPLRVPSRTAHDLDKALQLRDQGSLHNVWQDIRGLGQVFVVGKAWDPIRPWCMKGSPSHHLR